MLSVVLSGVAFALSILALLVVFSILILERVRSTLIRMGKTSGWQYLILFHPQEEAAMKTGYDFCGEIEGWLEDVNPIRARKFSAYFHWNDGQHVIARMGDLSKGIRFSKLPKCFPEEEAECLKRAIAEKIIERFIPECRLEAMSKGEEEDGMVRYSFVLSYPDGKEEGGLATLPYLVEVMKMTLGGMVGGIGIKLAESSSGKRKYPAAATACFFRLMQGDATRQILNERMAETKDSPWGSHD